MPNIFHPTLHRHNLLAGFTHIPLCAADLAPFGDEVEVGARVLRAVHRDHAGRETGRENIHGGSAGGFSFTAGGRKALFRSPITKLSNRLVITDGPLQAIALAALEHADVRITSTYAAPGGPMTRAAEAAVLALVEAMAPLSVILAFAPAADGMCRSRDICRHLLAGLILPSTPTMRVMVPPDGDGWVAALHAARTVGQAA